MLALTGARLSEVCQGQKADIITRDGLPFLRIHDDPAADETKGEARRSVKNESSVRVVPIHPVLVAEGFLDYVAQLPAASPLFPDIRPDGTFGNRGNTATKMIQRWLRGTLGLTDRAISPSHSWRHWFIDRARDAGLDLEVRHALTGHADDGNESHRYGIGFRAMPQRLHEEISKIRLPALPSPVDKAYKTATRTYRAAEG